MATRLQRAEKINGWMRRAELLWLENAADGLDCVVEFGSFLGRSSVMLTAAKHLICVDRWVVDKQEASNNEFAVGTNILDVFLRNLSFSAANVTAVRCDLGNDVLRNKLAATYSHVADLVFVDASHDYASVKKDIQLALRICKSGGILCGHDYSNAWPGVIAAVKELLPAATPTGAGTIWSVRLPL